MNTITDYIKDMRDSKLDGSIVLTPETAVDPTSFPYGVIVARFQTPYLHEGQLELLRYVNSKHKQMIVILGIAPEQNSINDPYDFQTRAFMIHELYPNAIVSWQRDKKKDSTWSKEIDHQLYTLSYGKKCLLYGSRDSFIPYYKDHGRNKCQGLDTSAEGKSGTLVRAESAQKPMTTKGERVGYLSAITDALPVERIAVDIAGVSTDESGNYLVLLGKKPDEDFWRFPGGMKDMTDKSFEAVAVREFAEETGGLVLTDLKYYGSQIIDDPRYRKSKNHIMGVLFVGELNNPEEGVPSDDLSDGLKSFPIPESIGDIREFAVENIMPEHRELFINFCEKFNEDLI